MIASSYEQGILSETYSLRSEDQAQGYYLHERVALVAFHHTPGYETYRGMGWRGVIEQKSIA